MDEGDHPIATEIENSYKKRENADFVFGILCDQLPHLKNEAIKYGQPISKHDHPGAIVFSEKITERYQKLSKDMNIDSCNID